MRQSMTHDQGREMAMKKELSRRTNIAVYLCDPHSPWQSGSSENTNGLERQYLSKGIDFRATARSSSMRLQIRSTTGPERAWAYDHPWQSVENSCSTARNIPPSFIEPPGVALQT